MPILFCVQEILLAMKYFLFYIIYYILILTTIGYTVCYNAGGDQILKVYTSKWLQNQILYQPWHPDITHFYWSCKFPLSW